MSKTIGAAIIAIVILISSMTLFTGCAESSDRANERPVAVVFVLGAHANSKVLNLNSDLVKGKLQEAATSYGMVAAVSNDENPELVYSRKYEVEDRYKGNRELLEKLGKEAAVKDLQQLQLVRANDAEVDTLESLRLAVRTFESAPQDAEKVLIVLDTGLSTTGLLDFQGNLINAEAETIAQQLSEREAVPDLSGISVFWQGMGDVEMPQPELSPAQRKNLERIWKAVVEKGGGSFEAMDYVPNPADDSEALPKVSVVDLPQEAALRFDPASISFDEPRVLSEEQVRFIGDSDRYAEPEKAESVIEPVAVYMKNNSGFRLLLVGTTAGDQPSEYTTDLSARRAETVRRTLIAFGIEESRIRVLGMGPSDPWHIPGAGTGSNEMASQNRKVVLLDLDSETAQNLL